MREHTFSDFVIGICAVIWLALMVMLTGSLDSDTMTVGQVITFILKHTFRLLALSGISLLFDFLYERSRKNVYIRIFIRNIRNGISVRSSRFSKR